MEGIKRKRDLEKERERIKRERIKTNRIKMKGGEAEME